MSKKNLPYIDLYTGDWIKDCSILSCKAEGAWLRIVMKLHSKGKQFFNFCLKKNPPLIPVSIEVLGFHTF